MLLGLILGIVIGLVLNALIIWIVGRLNLGLRVSGFGGAILAAIIIALVSWVIAWLLGLLGIMIGAGLLGAIVSFIIAAIVLLISDRILPGLEVDGFGGAVIAAIAIAVIHWLIAFVLAALGVALA
jgi:putative membrane protein